MAKKRRQFHCERCGSPCEIYKKGKAHRVLVCPQCGVIATNPIPLLAAALAKPALRLGKKAVSAAIGRDDKPQTPPPRERAARNSYTTEEMVHDLKIA